MKKYYLKGASAEYGPFSVEELDQMYIAKDALVKTENTDWTQAEQVEEIAVLLNKEKEKGVMHWGDFKKDHCTGNGFRQYSSVLKDIPWGQDWEDTCLITPAFVNGIYFPYPSRCVNKGYMWGEFDVPDTTCISQYAALNLHIKILTYPTTYTIDQMVNEMRTVYATGGIQVNWVTTEILNTADPALVPLNDLDTGACTMGSVTAEQMALSNFRKDAGTLDIVVYVCRSVFGSSGPLNGCAAYPLNRPMAVIAAYSTINTLGHEVGHVLGLRHTTDPRDTNRLMTGGGTQFITNLPADLIPSEVSTMLSSPFTN